MCAKKITEIAESSDIVVLPIEELVKVKGGLQCPKCGRNYTQGWGHVCQQQQQQQQQ